VDTVTSNYTMGSLSIPTFVLDYDFEDAARTHATTDDTGVSVQFSRDERGLLSQAVWSEIFAKKINPIRYEHDYLRFEQCAPDTISH